MNVKAGTLILEDTLWNENRIIDDTVTIFPGATLTIKGETGTSFDSIATLFLNFTSNGSIRVHPTASLVIEDANIVGPLSLDDLPDVGWDEDDNQKNDDDEKGRDEDDYQKNDDDGIFNKSAIDSINTNFNYYDDGKEGIGITFVDPSGGSVSLMRVKAERFNNVLVATCCSMNQKLIIRNSTFANNIQALSGYTGYMVDIYNSKFIGNDRAVSDADWTFSNCLFAYNNQGVNAERTKFRGCMFMYNKMAASDANGYGSNWMEDSFFFRNKVGIGRGCCGSTYGSIIHTTFMENEIGIKCNTGLSHVENVNFINNTDYSIYYTSSLMSLVKNSFWWGTYGEEAIKAKIFDAYDGSGRGIVQVESFRATPTLHPMYSNNIEKVLSNEFDFDFSGKEKENEHSEDGHNSHGEDGHNSHGSKQDDSAVEGHNHIGALREDSSGITWIIVAAVSITLNVSLIVAFLLIYYKRARKGKPIVEETSQVVSIELGEKVQKYPPPIGPTSDNPVTTDTEDYKSKRTEEGLEQEEAKVEIKTDYVYEKDDSQSVATEDERSIDQKPKSKIDEKNSHDTDDGS